MESYSEVQKSMKPFISTTLATGLIFSLTSLPANANALPVGGAPKHQTTDESPNDFSPADVDRLARNLEDLFSNGATVRDDGSVFVDSEQILEAFGPAKGAEILAQLQPNNRLPGQVAPLASAPTSYGKCVLNVTGFGTLFGAAEGTIIGYLNRKQWKKAAQTMVKFLGKQAIKGGVVGLAASLAAGSVWCLTPWAR